MGPSSAKAPPRPPHRKRTKKKTITGKSLIQPPIFGWKSVVNGGCLMGGYLKNGWYRIENPTKMDVVHHRAPVDVVRYVQSG